MSNYKFTTLPEDTIGFGTMSATIFSPLPQDEINKLYKAAYNTGARLFNCGEFYGPDFANLKAMAQFLETYPEVRKDIIVSVKGCFSMATRKPDGSKEGVKRSIEACLTHLPRIDVFEPARIDKNVPVEDTIRYIEEYVKAGKIGGISLSEVSAQSIRRAVKVAPIAFVESEFSLFERDILEHGIAEACAELRIPILAYSPLGSGNLGGQISSIDDLAGTDLRRMFDRFQAEAIAKNQALVKSLAKVAEQNCLSLPQLSLAWIKFFNSEENPEKAKYPLFIPIPGSSKPERAADNSKIRKISLSTFEEIGELLEKHAVAGGRYNAEFQEYLET